MWSEPVAPQGLPGRRRGGVSPRGEQEEAAGAGDGREWPGEEQQQGL